MGDEIPFVDQAPAITRVATSDQIVAQTLEGLFVYLEDDGRITYGRSTRRPCGSGGPPTNSRGI